MEAPLASLHGSLDAIRAQCSASKSTDSAPSYFTNAVLRPDNVDILELIRDADQLEASMFAYPPEDVERERGAETPRAPQIKPVHIPTPLRKGVTSAPGEHSAQFYLLAAEKLMQS